MIRIGNAELYARLQQLAKADDRSVRSYVEHVLQAHVASCGQAVAPAKLASPVRPLGR